ncbi:hypothetical protein [Parasphingorhabdus sp.]|uniref:hypothetical protein n=1 Tax=Parasphingorhabdus sp. TaxID=2709688 RepID=UPI0030A2CB00|nr:hypothetical protein [Sphingomonadales bacterium]
MKAKYSKAPAERVVKDIRRATRKQYSADDLKAGAAKVKNWLTGGLKPKSRSKRQNFTPMA